MPVETPSATSFRGLRLLDHQLRLVRDAVLTVDGLEVPFSSLHDRYLLPDKVVWPAHLRAEHPDFESLDYPNFLYLHDQVYLLHADDVGYWYHGIQVACLPYQNDLLVYLYAGEPEPVGRSLQKKYPLQQVRTLSGLHPRTSDRIHPPILVMKMEAGEKAEAILSGLNEEEAVHLACPMLTHDPEGREVFGLAPYLQAFFATGTSEAEARETLAPHGLTAEANRGFSRDGFLRVRLPRSIHLGAIDLAGRLQQLPLLRYVDNDVLKQKTPTF